MSRGHGGLALAIVLLVGGLLAEPAAAQDPADGEAGRVVAQDAIDGLLELASYRLEQTTTTEGAPVASTELVVTRVQGEDPALRVEERFDGEVGLEVVVTAEDAWASILGGPMQPMADQGLPVPDPYQPADGELRMLQVAIEEGFTIAKLGVEDIGEVPATHYRGTTLGPLPSPIDGYYERTLQGTIDLWVATNGGYLVQAVVDVLDNQRGRRAGPDTFRVTESVRVVDVGDSATTIVRPPTGTPLPEPSGVADPAAAQLVRDAVAQLGTLDSWRATLTTRVMGTEDRLDLTVVNEPPAAVNVVQTSNGELFLEYRIVGDRTWARNGRTRGAWEPADGGIGPECLDDPCSVAEAIAVITTLADDAGTFRLVGDETLDGVPAHHLRSEAGTWVGDLGRVPAVTDLWVAADDGRLLRRTIDGQALAGTLTIEGVNDPANTLAEPSPLASAEPGS